MWDPSQPSRGTLGLLGRSVNSEGIWDRSSTARGEMHASLGSRDIPASVSALQQAAKCGELSRSSHYILVWIAREISGGRGGKDTWMTSECRYAIQIVKPRVRKGLGFKTPVRTNISRDQLHPLEWFIMHTSRGI